jgi:hypothetical protein
MVAIAPWYAHVPKTPVANRQWRLDVLREARGSARARSYLREACAADTLFWVNGFIWTYDPRLSVNKTMPFITWAIQDHSIPTIEGVIEGQRDLVIGKHRDAGASWQVILCYLKRWQFERDSTFMVISRDLDEVDKTGNPDALFFKIDKAIEYQPDWLLPKHWERQKYMIRNLDLGCTFNGEATVEGAGVGGRRTSMLFDEAALIEQMYAMLLGTADVSNSRIFLSTARGKGNAYYDLTQDPHKKKLWIQWYTDPRKNRKLYQWDGASQRLKYYRFDEKTLEVVECPPHRYGPEDADTVNYDPPGMPFEPIKDGELRSPTLDNEERRRGKQNIAINWRIDFGGSAGSFFDLSLLTELNGELCSSPLWEGDITIDSVTGEITEFVQDKGGPLRFWFHMDLNGEVPRSPKGYGCGCDLSWGTGASNSAASWLDGQTGEKVAEYVRPDEYPDRFAIKVVALCRLFKNQSGTSAFLAWERIGPGNHFQKKVLELGYSNIYYHGKKLSDEISASYKPGWPPNDENRYELFGEYQAALRLRQFKNRSAPALAECERYVHTDKGVKYSSKGESRLALTGEEDPSGARENHGDRPTADALALRSIKTLLGGRWLVQKPEDAEPELPKYHPGTFAGRMAIHRRNREEREWD